ncbi:hypothetical protein L917_04702, partial [Phytophthora nicotianae]
MKRANTECSLPELKITYPCIVCDRGVHHLCCDDAYDAGALAERFCRTHLLGSVEDRNSTPSTSAENDAALSSQISLSVDPQMSQHSRER